RRAAVRRWGGALGPHGPGPQPPRLERRCGGGHLRPADARAPRGRAGRGAAPMTDLTPAETLRTAAGLLRGEPAPEPHPVRLPPRRPDVYADPLADLLDDVAGLLDSCPGLTRPPVDGEPRRDLACRIVHHSVAAPRAVPGRPSRLGSPRPRPSATAFSPSSKNSVPAPSRPPKRSATPTPKWSGSARSWPTPRTTRRRAPRRSTRSPRPSSGRSSRPPRCPSGSA